jgi:hypothetical protein
MDVLPGSGRLQRAAPHRRVWAATQFVLQFSLGRNAGYVEPREREGLSLAPRLESLELVESAEQLAGQVRSIPHHSVQVRTTGEQPLMARAILVGDKMGHLLLGLDQRLS